MSKFGKNNDGDDGELAMMPTLLVLPPPYFFEFSSSVLLSAALILLVRSARIFLSEAGLITSYVFKGLYFGRHCTAREIALMGMMAYLSYVLAEICRLAESNPNAVFLKVNYEELKTMCYSLNIHVLPFFRFHRGAEGKLCSFSCTNATIKKFKDALAKYGGSESCSLGPARGLEESEIMALVSAGELPRTANSPFELEHNKKMTMGDLVLDDSTSVRDVVMA